MIDQGFDETCSSSDHCRCPDCREQQLEADAAQPSPTSRLLELFDAASQCRALVHLSTTDQPAAVASLRAWCSAHKHGLRTIRGDVRTYRVDLPNGGVIQVTEFAWP